MKSKLLSLLLLTISLSAAAQSDSFITLKNKFQGGDNVVSVKAGSFLVKTVLLLTDDGDWEDDFGKVKSVRLINIPQAEFKRKNVTTKGFKKILAKDKFEELVSTYNEGERLTIFQRDGKNGDLYFMIIENGHDVTALEIRGELYPEKIVEDHSKRKSKTT
ncbi:DUF4252 domain-containing protein [Pseudochryseolinea flava]|nr:DUF4252 domain-containing protein [Pseudochryseolinea flava]